MQNEIFNIIKEAKKAIGQLNDGKKYTTAYICDRFFKSAERNPHDILINNMRDVIEKKSSTQEFISQAEITNIYDQMLGLGGGNSAFRAELHDLLLEKRQFVEPKRTTSALRGDDGDIKIDAVNQELSDAFSVALGLGNSNSFAAHIPQQNSLVKRIVIASLTAEGMTPNAVEIISENNHFALVAASYNDGNQSIAIHVPVQITNGFISPPSSIVSGENTIKLSKDNLWIAIKDAKNNKKQVGQRKFAHQRDLEKTIKIAADSIPSELERFANFETSLINASTNHSSKVISETIVMISDELKSFGTFNPHVKIASATEKEILFNAHIPTENGPAIIRIPVEIHNGHPNLPGSFLSSVSNEEKVYDFSTTGYSRFLSDANTDSKKTKIARQSDYLSFASYSELTDMMLNGIANKDYKAAEDIISIIQDRFDSSHFIAAFDKFTQLLKYSSNNEESERTRNIEAAVKRGDLIKRSTTLELFSPKLGLSLNKLAFDDEGRLIPKHALKSNFINEDKMIFSSNNIKIS